MGPGLTVVMDDTVAGSLTQTRGGQTVFEYDPDYASNPDATPLSLSLPPSRLVHRGHTLDAWLRNLLPDNADVLARWGTQFKVSAASPFALLHHVGRDVAGAVQFVPATDPRVADGGINWLTTKKVAERIQHLKADPAAWTPLGEQGQFSLAGAQSKLALRKEGRRWGEPRGDEPTTHIIKPPMPNYDHQEVNEHLCLEMSRNLGLPTARSRVMHFGEHQVVVIERYDRVADDTGQLRRVHQEDLCQALGIDPSKKYQSQGGPGPVEVIDLLRRQLGPAGSADAINTFLRALALAWVIGGTDAHAKNYSLLLAGRQIVLAPLYDLNSVLPYLVPERRSVAPGRVSIHSARLAMTIGGNARLADITRRDWESLAAQARLTYEHVLERVTEVVDEAPQAIDKAVSQTKALTDEQQDFAERLAVAITQRSSLCRASILGRSPTGRGRR